MFDRLAQGGERDIVMQVKHRGRSITGHAEVHPAAQGLRALAASVLARAACDVAGRDPWLSEDALGWLNSEEGRAIAAAFGLLWPAKRRQITADDLRARQRNIYMRGD